jgi:hypothetical protein
MNFSSIICFIFLTAFCKGQSTSTFSLLRIQNDTLEIKGVHGIDFLKFGDKTYAVIKSLTYSSKIDSIRNGHTYYHTTIDSVFIVPFSYPTIYQVLMR